ncbi:MAG: hypothetical protein CO093_01295 [Alphaproteobacteria bacterium CG_4_9_14_3_um_filter_47_13]|nr:MAG: hypothetical protein CO093_01295 [Alphaproteobacteria bacterium CG_4_9_14_3_um_filter_47_13]
MKGRNYNLTWFLGLAAALFLALGPAVAPILSASPKGRYIEICTAFGVVKRAVEADFAIPGQKQEHSGKSSPHCLFCNLRQLALLLPEAPDLSVPADFSLFISVPSHEMWVAGLPFALAYNSRAPPFS